MEALVYHAGALGDFLTILPVLEVWRRLDPGGRVTLLGRPGFGELARGSGLVDGVWDVEGADAAHLFDARPLPPPVAERLPRFAAALAFAAPHSPLIGHLKAAGIPMVLHQSPFPADRTHVIDYHLSLLSEAIPPAPETMHRSGWGLAPEAAVLVPEPGRTVLLHAGSGSFRKNWPFERYYALAGLLKGEGLRTTWLHGPAEPELEYPPGDAVLQGLPLTVVAQLLSMCRLYVGNDSGISHLAAVSGCQTVVLFGASDPSVWAPRGGKVTLLAGGAPCAPCHPHAAADLTRCRCHCMTGITVSAVYEACRRQVGRRRT